ncbi:MAG TPA: hypothetical protein VGA03_13635 [Anaerolineales bacterium]
MKRESRRFSPSKWSDLLVPVLLGILFLALVATLVLVLLSVLGVIPAV